MQQEEEEPIEVQLAKEMCGIMQKKSPNKLKGYQQRYFTLCKSDDTYQLSYFQSQDQRKPLGSIDLSEVIKIEKKDDKKIKILYPQRCFEFKLTTQELRDNWVKSIQVLMDYLQQIHGSEDPHAKAIRLLQKQNNSQKNWKKFTDRSMSTISFDKEMKLISESNSLSQSMLADNQLNRGSFVGRQSLKRDSLNPNMVNTLSKSPRGSFSQFSNQPSPQPSNNNSKLKNSTMMGTVDLDGEDLYEKSGVKEYLSGFSQDFSQNRVIYGCLSKRSKGKVKYFMKRFFILVSAKSLNQYYTDEEILQEKDLPPWLELDTLYYFKVKDKQDMGQPKGTIKMEECIEIFEKDMTTSKEDGFTFRVNCGERIFHLMAETSTERKNWINALRQSVITAKELKGNIKVKKNIDKIIKTYDHNDYDGQPYGLLDKRKNLREKIDEDILKVRDFFFDSQQIQSQKAQDILILKNQFFQNPQNFQEFLIYLNKLSQELLNVLEACLAKEIKRNDIIQEYINYFHSEIFTSESTKYWDQNHEKLESIEMIQFANFLLDYSINLKQFFEDGRLVQGAKLLIKIYRMNTLDGAKDLVQNIINYEKKETNIQSNEQGLLQSSTPVDLYKIISTAFDIAFSVSKKKEIGICMAQYAKQTVEYYQNKLQELLDEYDLELSQEICFCNNIIQFSSLTSQYDEKLQKNGNLNQEECNKYFNSTQIKQKFIKISSDAQSLVFQKMFSSIDQYFSKKYFLDLNIEDSLQQIIEKAAPSLRILHDRYSRKIWKDLIECISLFYFQCMIVSCPKSKKDHLNNFIEKIEEDLEFLQESFKDMVFEKTLNQCLKPFEDIIGFLKAKGLQVQQYCRQLRIGLGKQFTQRTIKSLMVIRYDLDKKEKQEILEACVETIQTYNKENQDETVNSIQTNQFSELGELGEDSDDGKNKKKVQNQEQQIKYKETIDLNNDDEEQEDNLNETARKLQNSDNKNKEDTPQEVQEGWLEKRKENKTTFQRRFFRIRNGYLYWYLSDRAQYCQKKIELEKIEEEILAADDKKTFTIVFQSQKDKIKHYKFKCESLEERSTWVYSLKKAIQKQKQQGDQFEGQEIIMLGEGQQPLFKDYYEIKRKEQQRQQQMLQRQRLLELQQYEQNQQIQEKKQVLQFEISLDSRSSSLQTNKSRKSLRPGIKPQEEFGSKQDDNNDDNNDKTPGCWDQCLMFIGVKNSKPKNQQQNNNQLNTSESSLTQKFDV